MRLVKMIIVSTIAAILSGTPGQAGPRRAPIRRLPAPRRVIVRPPAAARRIVVGGINYWIHAGVYYKFSDGGYVVVSAPLLKILPKKHKVIVIGGVAYYFADNIYYKSSPGGYVVVEKPIESVEVASKVPDLSLASLNTITLYVPKRSEEGFVAVTLKKLQGGGYLGPQGEFHPTMPAVALLTEIYGIPEELHQIRSDVFIIYVPNKDSDDFTRVILTRHKDGFLGPQGEFYPLIPSVAHLSEMYGTSEKAVKVEDEVIRVQVPKKSGDGFVEVKLKKHIKGYLGPQGEFYPKMPSTNQLTEIYGVD